MSQAVAPSAIRTVVRRAVPSDIPQMVMLGRLFADESGYAKHGFIANPNVLHASLEVFVSSDRHGVFVADRAGELVGVSAAVLAPIYFADATIATEIFWWVREDIRGSRSAFGLMKALEDWAESSGCTAVCMIDLAAVQGPAADIYKRKGYEVAERTWIKRIE